MKIVSYCPTAGRYSTVCKRQIREIELNDRWLAVDFRHAAWTGGTKLDVFIDGRCAYSVSGFAGDGTWGTEAFDVGRFRGKTARLVLTAADKEEFAEMKDIRVLSATTDGFKRHESPFAAPGPRPAPSNLYPLAFEDRTYWVLQRADGRYQLLTREGNVFKAEGRLQKPFADPATHVDRARLRLVKGEKGLVIDCPPLTEK